MRKMQYLVLLISILAQAQQMQVATGTLQRFEKLKSRYIQPRDVYVWLPEGYDAAQKYAVLYMHDGQNLFDAKATWNSQAWDVDDTAGKLQAENKTQKFIVVAIANIGNIRHSDLFPQKPFESLPKKTQDSLYQLGKENQQPLFGRKIDSDNYLKFIVKELKPFVDKHFSVYQDRAHTFIAGSSMGGLISMYAICEYPGTFGGAACLSTHWPGTFSVKDNPIPKAFLDYLQRKLPSPKTHKFYFDYGDQTLDALYEPYQLKADAILKYKGFTDKNWMTKFFPGKDHSENAWKERLHISLEFLLAK